MKKYLIGLFLVSFIGCGSSDTLDSQEEDLAIEQIISGLTEVEKSCVIAEDSAEAAQECVVISEAATKGGKEAKTNKFAQFTVKLFLKLKARLIDKACKNVCIEQAKLCREQSKERKGKVSKADCDAQEKACLAAQGKGQAEDNNTCVLPPPSK